MMSKLKSFAHFSVVYRIYTLSFSFLLVFCTFVHLSASGFDKKIKEKKSKAVTQSNNPGQMGTWVNAFSSEPAVHMSVLPSGKTISWSQWLAYSSRIQTHTTLWNPSNNTLTYPHNYDINLFCSGHSFLPDGRLMITSGTLNKTYFDGPDTVTLFDYQTDTWSYGPSMNNGRWYPTNVQLGNGETITAGGSYCLQRDANGICITNPLGFNHVPQAYNTIGGIDSWRTLSGASPMAGYIFYPWLLLASDGRVFNAGPLPETYFLNTSGNGSWSGIISKSNYGARGGGSAVMYDVDKVLILGGGQNPPTNSAEVIDLSVTNANPSWRVLTNPMQYRRNHSTATILADGKVLVTGGTKGPGSNNTCVENYVLAAELWNPLTETFTTMASGQYPRLYHSTAVLLPDARVLVGGTTYYPANGTIDENTDTPCPNEVQNQNQTEIFTPPYLYNPNGTAATRPIINSAPTNVTYGQQFIVGVPGVPTISKVNLVRLSSVTHSFNQNQRFNSLSFNKVSAGLRVVMPTNPNACPPGHYMLFVVNSAGVPSLAKIIRVS